MLQPHLRRRHHRARRQPVQDPPPPRCAASCRPHVRLRLVEGAHTKTRTLDRTHTHTHAYARARAARAHTHTHSLAFYVALVLALTRGLCKAAGRPQTKMWTCSSAFGGRCSQKHTQRMRARAHTHTHARTRTHTRHRQVLSLYRTPDMIVAYLAGRNINDITDEVKSRSP